jgi:hypothetical protein
MKQLCELFKEVIDGGQEENKTRTLSFQFEVWSDKTFRALPFIGNHKGVLLDQFDFMKEWFGELSDSELRIAKDGVPLNSISHLVEQLMNGDNQFGFSLMKKDDPTEFIFRQFGCIESQETEDFLSHDPLTRHPSLEISINAPTDLLGIPFIVNSGLVMFILLAHYSKITELWAKTNNYVIGELHVSFNRGITVSDMKEAKAFLDRIPALRLWSLLIKNQTPYIESLDVEKEVFVDENFENLLK